MRYLILILFSFQALGEDWFCKHESGKREGNVIWSCGIGESMEEAYARTNALEEAKKEFIRICVMSDDCRDKHTIVSPQRTECLPYNGHWKCYRMIEVVLQ